MNVQLHHSRRRIFQPPAHSGWDAVPYLSGFNNPPADSPIPTPVALFPWLDGSDSAELESIPRNEALLAEDWLPMEPTLFQHPFTPFDCADVTMGSGHEDSADRKPNVDKIGRAEVLDSAFTLAQRAGRSSHPYRRAGIKKSCQTNWPEENRALVENPRTDCRCMHKDHPSLHGPLPPHHETLAYLQQIFGVAGADPDIPLSSRFWDDDGNRGCPQWRQLCLLAIWTSPAKSLTTEGIHQALIAAVPYCHEKAHEAKRQKGKQKRTGWPASVAAVLSKERIFTQRTNDGRKSKDWRIDIRGAGFHAQQSKCQHNRIPRS